MEQFRCPRERRQKTSPLAMSSADSNCRGKKVANDSPLLQKWLEEQACATTQKDIVLILKARFKAVPEELAARIRSVNDLQKLKKAVTLAARCTSLDAFRKRFPKG
jgi:hypothetical protein